MPTLNKLPRVAAIIAFVIAGIIVLFGLLGPILVLPFAIIPLCAGIGILRKRVWSAYGFATYFFAQLVLIPFILFRPASSTGGILQVVVTVICSLLLGILYLFSGRSLAASGAARGKAFPWIVAAALTTVQNGALQVAAGSPSDPGKAGHCGPGRSHPYLAEGSDSEWIFSQRKVCSTQYRPTRFLSG